MSNWVWKEFQAGAIAAVASLLLASCGGGGGSPSDTVLKSGSGEHMPQCVETVATCFAINNAQIATYRGGKQAAASYTFDDGLMSAFGIADLFAKLKLHASFYINPGLVHGDQEWQRWKGVAAEGHEIGNHTMWHVRVADATLPDSKLKFQILDAQTLIEQKIGIRPLIFVFPYDTFDDRSMQMVMSTHIATRLPGFRTDPRYDVVNFTSTLTLGEANDSLQRSVDSGGWMVAAGHGVDGNGFSPVTMDFLTQHLSFAQSLSDKLWIDTFLEVSRYRLCRGLARPDIAITQDGASIRFKGDFSAGYCTAPLTISIPVAGQLASQIVLSTPDGKAVPFQQAGSNLIADLTPGQELRLTLKPKQ